MLRRVNVFVKRDPFRYSPGRNRLGFLVFRVVVFNLHRLFELVLAIRVGLYSDAMTEIFMRLLAELKKLKREPGVCLSQRQ